MIDPNVIKRFVANFSLIRKSIGWTAEELGNRIEVSRQTIMNIEKDKKITTPIYMAIRTEFESEIDLHPTETEMLKVALDAFVDNPEKYKPEEIEEIEKEITFLAPALRDKNTERKDVSSKWTALLGLTIGAAILGVFAKIMADAWRKH